MSGIGPFGWLVDAGRSIGTSMGLARAGGESSAYGVGQWMNDLTGKSAQQDFDAEQARIAREDADRKATIAYERDLYLSNTALQRQVADAKSAGINPYYIAGGGGASVPNQDAPSAAVAAGGASGSWSPVSLLSSIVGAALRVGLYRSIAGSALKAAATGSSAAVVKDVARESAAARQLLQQREFTHIALRQQAEVAKMVHAATNSASAAASQGVRSFDDLIKRW